MINIDGYIKGADISTLIEQEENGAVYYDHGVRMDLLEILKSYGFNSACEELSRSPLISSLDCRGRRAPGPELANHCARRRGSALSA